MRSPRIVLYTLLLVLLLVPLCALGQIECPDIVGHHRTLNVLTINLLFSEVTQRQARLTRIADYAAERAATENPIDVFQLQEVVSGALVETTDSSADLQQLLADRGLFYDRRTGPYAGVPGVVVVGNATLSRCPINFSISQILPVVTEEPFPGTNLSIPIFREVLLTGVSVPGFGPIHIYNTHLCAFCDPVTERLRQADALLDFISLVENYFPGNTPVVLGGDFNTDLNLNSDRFVYRKITHDGFIDSYRQGQANKCFSCCDPANSREGIAGCTYAVDGNPYAGSGLFTSTTESRIDYIFLRSSHFGVAASSVVFPPPDDTFVSDHSAVLTEINLQ